MGRLLGGPGQGTDCAVEVAYGSVPLRLHESLYLSLLGAHSKLPEALRLALCLVLLPPGQLQGKVTTDQESLS